MLTRSRLCATRVSTRSYSSSQDPLPPGILRSEVLNSYKTSHPPTAKSLRHAGQYFAHGPVSFLFSASRLHNLPSESKAPEIAFLGRSNVGKSSLLNALLLRKNQKLAHESRNPGRTKTLNLFGLGPSAMGVPVKRTAKAGMSLELLGKKGEQELKKETEVKNMIATGGLVVVDCPGYGFGSRDEWGEVVIRYLEKREQLAQAYLLFDASVGITSGDEMILDILKKENTPFQVVLSKVDRLLFPGGNLGRLHMFHKGLLKLKDLQDTVRKSALAGTEGTNVSQDILCTSSNDGSLGKYKRIGIDELQYAVLQAAGLMKDAKASEKIAKQQEEEEYHDVVGWDQLQRVSAGKRQKIARP